MNKILTKYLSLLVIAILCMFTYVASAKIDNLETINFNLNEYNITVVDTIKRSDYDVDDFGRLDYSTKPKEYVVSKIKAKGLKYIDPQIIINTSGLVVGDTIILPGEHLSNAARKLLDQRFFFDVKVATKFVDDDNVEVTFLLKERPRVANWYFEGVKKSQIEDLLENLRLRKGSEMSDYVMDNSIRLIKEYYLEKAYRQIEIEYTVEPDSLFAGAVNVTFNINTNKKQKIKEIKIEGAKELEPKKIARSMKHTKAKSINIFNDTKFKDKEFPEDRQNIVNYMKSKGYRDAEVLADSLYDINDKRIGVWIKIKEGKKYYYRDITWIGNSKYPTDYLDKFILAIKKGDTYDSEAMDARLGLNGKTKQGQASVDGLYKDDGYLGFRIQPFETVVGDSVDVEIRIVEGDQFRIKNVTFEGNTRTNDHVIRRDLETVPGDLYSQSLLMRTYQRLASMGQFDAQTLTPNVIPNMQAETVDINYSLTEVSNDKFEFSLGVGGGFFIASVGVRFTNVSLRKFFDKDAWRPYPSGDAQTLALSIQSNGTYYKAGSISITEPWFGGKRPTQLTVGIFASQESNAFTIGQQGNQFFTTMGANVSIGKRLSWPDPFFTTHYGLSVQSYNMDDWQYFILQNGWANTIALNLSIGRNSIDDPFQYPTQGSNISLSLAVTPPYSLLDNKDYASTSLSEQDRYRWIEYHKWRLDAQWFFPLSPNRKLVLMARAQYGFLGSYNKNKISPFEGFQVGGDGLAGYNLYGVETIGLRGYENGALTPFASQYARVFSKYTAELRYPIIREGSTTVYALVFAEAGNAFVDPIDFKPFQLRKAAGVGLRLFLPMLGMLGIDWGYGFDAVPASNGSPSASQFHFTIGGGM